VHKGSVEMGKFILFILLGSLSFNFISCDYKNNKDREIETDFKAEIAMQIGDDDFLKERLKFWTNDTTFSELKEHLGKPIDVAPYISSYSIFEFIIVNDVTEYTIRVDVLEETLSNIEISKYKTDGTGEYVRLEDSNDEFIKEKLNFLKESTTLDELKEHLGEPYHVDASPNSHTLYAFDITNDENNTDYSLKARVLSGKVFFIHITKYVNDELQKPIMWSSAE
jgi:hypothetical protein